MFCRLNVSDGLCKEVDPVCVILRPVPSPIMTSSDPVYWLCMERLLRSAVMWWDAPLSRSHEEAVGFVVAAW